jgi:hypothetical protein
MQDSNPPFQDHNVTIADRHRWTFKPFTRAVTELYVNTAYCRMIGLPVDELLARVARRDMPERLGLLDHLCLCIDSLHAKLQDGGGCSIFHCRCAMIRGLER